MGDSQARITRIEMPDGTEVWARISGAEELTEPTAAAEPVPSTGPSFTDVGARPGSGPSFTDIRADRRAGRASDRVQARVESLHGVVTSVARSLAEPLRSVRPDEVSVEFGIELTAKAGKVVGLLADGEAKGSIKVTLTWNGGPPVDPSSPAQVPAQATGQPAAPSVLPPVPSAPPLIGPPVPAPAPEPSAGQPAAGPAPEPVPVPPPASGAPSAGDPDGGGPSAGASTGAPAHASGTGPEDGSGS
ncbi:CU044_2847 family protein [Streptomyces sp. NPDC001777]|uniref:CU044_2847 family protein n=1 Tax=Streptomyces sp. NPDC001777 TaxID=3364608 RepID=UPI0036B4ADEC